MLQNEALLILDAYSSTHAYLGAFQSNHSLPFIATDQLHLSVCILYDFSFLQSLDFSKRNLPLGLGNMAEIIIRMSMRIFSETDVCLDASVCKIIMRNQTDVQCNKLCPTFMHFLGPITCST